MILPDLRLVLILTCSLTSIFFLFGWWFILKRSPLRLLLMFISQFIHRDTIGVHKEIPIPTEGSRLSDTMEEVGSAYTFDQAIQKVKRENPRPIQVDSAQVVVPQADNLTTTNIGYPRPLTEQEVDSNRPFLKISLDDNKDNK